MRIINQITNQQRGLVALTRAQNAVEEYVQEECQKAFQAGVERGALEQRMADRARANGTGQEFENVAGIGRDWAVKRSLEHVEVFAKFLNDKIDLGLEPSNEEIAVELGRLFMLVMGFEEEKKP